MKSFEEFKEECYLKDPQISLQTIELLYKIGNFVNNNATNNLDEKPKTKKKSKK
jgi:hypothetical protein